MAENNNNFEVVYSLPYMLHAPGCPVIIERGRLFEKPDGTTAVVLVLRSLSDKTIRDCVVHVQPLEQPGGRTWGSLCSFLYSNLNIARDSSFGDGQPLILEEDAAGACAFAAGVQSVTFADGSGWDGTKSEWGPIARPESLDDALPEQDAEKWREVWGEDCVCVPRPHKDLWWCTCGAWPNRRSEKTCHSCGRPQTVSAPSALQKTGIHPQKPGRKPQSRSRRVLMTMLMIGIGIAIAVPATMWGMSYARQDETYQIAAQEFENGDYEAAAQRFDTIPGFKDSDEWSGTQGRLQAAEQILSEYSAEPSDDVIEDAYNAAVRAEQMLTGVDPDTEAASVVFEKMHSIKYAMAKYLMQDLIIRAGEPMSDVSSRTERAAAILEDLGAYQSSSETAKTLRQERDQFEAAIDAWRDGDFNPVVELAKAETKYIRLDTELAALAEEFIPFIGDWTHVQGNAQIMATTETADPSQLSLMAITKDDGEVQMVVYYHTEGCLVNPFGADRSVFGFRSLSDPLVTLSVTADGSLIANRVNGRGETEDYAIYARDASTYVPVDMPEPSPPVDTEAPPAESVPAGEAPSDPSPEEPVPASPAEPAASETPPET